MLLELRFNLEFVTPCLHFLMANPEFLMPNADFSMPSLILDVNSRPEARGLACPEARGLGGSSRVGRCPVRCPVDGVGRCPVKCPVDGAP